MSNSYTNGFDTEKTHVNHRILLIECQFVQKYNLLYLQVILIKNLTVFFNFVHIYERHHGVWIEHTSL